MDYSNSIFPRLNSTQPDPRLQLIENPLSRAATRAPNKIKSLHWPKVPERSNVKVKSLTYNPLQYSLPTLFPELFSIQPTCSVRTSSCLSLLRPFHCVQVISSSLTLQPYPPVLHVSGTIGPLNYAKVSSFLHHCQTTHGNLSRNLYGQPRIRRFRFL